MFELYNDDCIKKINELAKNQVKVDAIIVDPPYGTTKCSWDIVIPFDKMWTAINSIRKSTTPIIVFGSEPFSSLLRSSNIKEYKYDIYWQKEKPTNFFQLKRRFGKTIENIMIFYNKQCTYNPQMVKHKGPLVHNQPKGKHKSILTGINKEVFAYKDNGYRYPCDVQQFNKVPNGHNLHITEKPLDLVKYLVKTFTNENDLILDFAMGSGTTGVACKQLNRNFIGIELDTNYFNIAKNRIEKCSN